MLGGGYILYEIDTGFTDCFGAGGVGCEQPRKKVQRQPRLCRGERRRRGDLLSAQRVPQPQRGAEGVPQRAGRWGRRRGRCSQPGRDKWQALSPSLEPKRGSDHTSRTLRAEKGKPGDAVTELRCRTPALTRALCRAAGRKGNKDLSWVCIPTEYQPLGISCMNMKNNVYTVFVTCWNMLFIIMLFHKMCAL